MYTMLADRPSTYVLASLALDRVLLSLRPFKQGEIRELIYLLISSYRHVYAYLIKKV
jgi:hypothetical protein